MTKPTLLITGASGSIGATLLPRIAKLNKYNLVSLGRTNSKNDFKVDLAHKDSLKVIKKINPDFVVHLAGSPSIQGSFQDPISDLMTNTAGTLNLLNGLDKKKRSVLVFISTAAIYGNNCIAPFVESSPICPESPYAVSKIAAEHYLYQKAKQFDIGWTSLVVTNSFGPPKTHRTGVITKIIDALEGEKEVKLYGKHTYRDFIHVEDVCDAILLALSHPTNSRLNISSSQEFSLYEVLTLIEQFSLKKIKVNWQAPKSGTASRSSLNNSKSKRLLGWSPKQDFVTSLKKIVLDSKSL